MTKLVCDACGKAIKANAGMIVVHTATTTERWHAACCPLGKERAPENAERARAQ